MIESLYQLAAVSYLIAALFGGYGIGLSHLKARRIGVVVMGAGWLMHTLGLFFLHEMPERPPLYDWSPAIALTVWLMVMFYLLLRLRMRISGMVVFVAPPAFIGMVFACLWFSAEGGVAHPASGFWSHMHIVLASGGLALLTVAAAAGSLFILANRLLKDRRPAARKIGLPSLEALDRVNLVSLSLGFPLLTLGLITGVLWFKAGVEETSNNVPHAVGTAIAWLVYVVLVGLRYGIGQESRQSPLAAARCAAAGFVALFIAVVGMRFLA
ncbi:MAG: cytochrome c biogenesis protein CcsA [Deltaproteobacteria bacterium]|nr:cytochrome c biogenesis protein CcsA [Deltaproteobacteria bacterium]